MNKKPRKKQVMKERPLRDSFASMKTRMFWKVFLLEFVLLLCFIVVITLFSREVIKLTPELLAITPLTKDIYTTLGSADLGANNAPLESLKDTIAEVKARAYSLVWKVVKYGIISVIALMILSAILETYSWSGIFRRKAEFRIFGLLLLFCFLFVILFVAGFWIAGIIFKRPANILVGCLVGGLLLYLLRLWQVNILTKERILNQIAGGFVDFIRHRYLLWAGLCLVSFIVLVFLSVYLLKIHAGFVTMCIILLVAWSAWIKVYLSNVKMSDRI
ncbi:hypothetical protein KY363_06460 [Candidatus Woesearchaeota archaeon]|nr:hypothetical protein [Candidatus Woesearchaeota archaeon]